MTANAVALPVSGIPDPESITGVSDAAEAVLEAWTNALQHFVAPVSRTPIAREFAELADTWREERRYSSSLTEIVLSPAYQRIVGLGYEVVPLILSELQTRPDHWFWALRSITGINPVPETAIGDLDAMARTWIQWGRVEGLVG